MREKEVITEWNSTVFDSLLGFFHPLFSLQRFLPAVLIFSRVGQLRISTLPSLALGACCIPALPRHGSELCRRFLPGLQVTVSNAINLPPWLQIVLESQGTQRCSWLPSPALLAAAPACMEALMLWAEEQHSMAQVHLLLLWAACRAQKPAHFVFFFPSLLSAVFWQTCEQWQILWLCLLACSSFLRPVLPFKK